MKQILIVEDDSFLNKMLAYNLTADGYEVTSALNTRTATAILNAHEFDLVFPCWFQYGTTLYLRPSCSA